MARKEVEVFTRPPGAAALNNNNKGGMSRWPLTMLGSFCCLVLLAYPLFIHVPSQTQSLSLAYSKIKIKPVASPEIPPPPPIYLAVVISADYSLDFLPYFIQHYLDLGVSAHNFRAVVHTKNNSSAQLEQTLAILKEFHIEHVQIWTGVFEVHMKRRQKMQALEDVPTSGWIIDVDDDELQEYPPDVVPQDSSNELPLIRLVRYLEANRIKVVSLSLSLSLSLFHFLFLSLSLSFSFSFSFFLY